MDSQIQGFRDQEAYEQIESGREMRWLTLSYTLNHGHVITS